MESMREILGGQKMQIIEQLSDELRHAQGVIDELLCYSGRPGFCPSCARPIRWIRSSAAHTITERAYNYNGEPHLCPDQGAK